MTKDHAGGNAGAIFIGRTWRRWSLPCRGTWLHRRARIRAVFRGGGMGGVVCETVVGNSWFHDRSVRRRASCRRRERLRL